MTRTDEILQNYRQGSKLTREDIKYLLSLRDEDERNKLYETAREVRKQNFDDKIFAYGFVYFTTYCKNNCTFCYYRQSNDLCDRYRKTPEEIVDVAKRLEKTGVHMIDLTMGEDPFYHCNGESGFDQLIDTVKLVKENIDLPVMISPGVVDEKTVDKLADIGVTWYALYQETHNIGIYNKLRLNQDYYKRLNIKEYAKNKNMLIEEGLLVGIGSSLDDMVDSFEEMERLKADQVRVMTFVPQKGTPLEDVTPTDDILELNIIACMRLLFKDKLIPASLDVEGLKGLKVRLDAGANVITSIIPANDHLRGVAQSTLDVSSNSRSIEGIKPVLDECNLTLATAEEYKAWVNDRKNVEVFA